MVSTRRRISASSMTNGGETCRAFPTRLRVNTPRRRASVTTASRETRLAGERLGAELDARQQADGTHLADGGMVREAPHLAGQHRLEGRARVRRGLRAPRMVQVGEADRAGRGVPGVGVAVAEHAAPCPFQKGSRTRAPAITTPSGR